jgi:hypothetical protein
MYPLTSQLDSSSTTWGQDALRNILFCFYYTLWFRCHKRRKRRFWEFITRYNCSKNIDTTPGIVIAFYTYVWNDRLVTWEISLRRKTRRKEWNMSNGTAFPDNEESPGLMARGFLIRPGVSQFQ